RITESDSNVNLSITFGSLEFWFRPSWLGTNQAGGSGPGAWGRLLDVGTTTSNASYGLWSLCFDPSGNVWFCGQTNNGTQATFLTTPVAWSTNNDSWTYFALTYSPSNSALYVNGTLITNGSGVTCFPNTNVLSKGFFLGSDSNGLAQAHGKFAS